MLQRRAIRKLEEGTGAVAVIEDAADTEEYGDLPCEEYSYQ